MSFYGMSFVFDGIPCEEFGLMMYDFESHEQENGTIGTEVQISEDRIWGRSKPIHYGVNENDAMKFKLICGVRDSDQRLDRFDIARIAGWLKKPSYRVLKIVQPDMEAYHYKCIITELVPIKVGLTTVGIDATVVCDGPYAYFDSAISTYICKGTSTTIFHNRSNINNYYYPAIVLSTTGGDISVVNMSDNNREMKLLKLPQKEMNITINGEDGTVVSSTGDNIYEFFNFRFLRFARGDNYLVMNGNFNLTIHTEFPVDIGC